MGVKGQKNVNVQKEEIQSVIEKNKNMGKSEIQVQISLPRQKESNKVPGSLS